MNLRHLLKQLMPQITQIYADSFSQIKLEINIIIATPKAWQLNLCKLV